MLHPLYTRDFEKKSKDYQLLSKTVEELAKKYNLAIPEVWMVWESQFKFIRHIIEKGGWQIIILSRVGKFYVNRKSMNLIKSKIV